MRNTQSRAAYCALLSIVDVKQSDVVVMYGLSVRFPVVFRLCHMGNVRDAMPDSGSK